jgi:hypothetical protein
MLEFALKSHEHLDTSEPRVSIRNLTVCKLQRVHLAIHLSPSNAPVERIEDHYRVNYFLPFIDHTISHINSRFTQGRKALFYGNDKVPALVNNVNQTDNVRGSFKITRTFGDKSVSAYEI